ncbi:MAG: DUF116 domain-containing protein [Firmicutes bacterium]|nr:DUF116 domain-containing protein [Bacillota bacterium]
MKARKRLFIGLAALTLVVVLAVLGLIISFSWWDKVGQVLALLVFIALAGMLVLAGAGLLAMVYAIKTGKGIKVKLPLRLIVGLLYPLTLQIGKLLGIEREKIQNSLVEVNNALVEAGATAVSPEKVLVLIPHCMQLDKCNHKITVDVNNCRRCGRCQINDMLALAEEYGVGLAVATGGGMARRIIQELRPQAVVAVACERDLTSGLQETFPLPVFGVVNIRPEGYCLNTKVDLDKIKAALDFFVHGNSDQSIKINQQVAVSQN